MHCWQLLEDFLFFWLSSWFLGPLILYHIHLIIRSSEYKSWGWWKLVLECQRLTGKTDAFVILEENMEFNKGSLLCSGKGSQTWT